MARDITETRREKLLAHLKANGGSMGMAELHEWSSLKLLCSHQPFSQLMEGLTDDGLVRWDGTTFTLADAPPGGHDHGGHDHGGHDHGGHDHDHGGHDHDHGGHDHDHAHGGPSKPHPKDQRYGDGSEIELPKEKPRRVTPPPPPPPPPAGLRATLKGGLKKLLGR